MKILVAMDDSIYSQAALTQFLSRSHLSKVKVHLLHVLTPFNPIEPSGGTPAEAWSAWVDKVCQVKKSAAQNLLLKAVESIQKQLPDAEIFTEIIEGYCIDQLIVNCAKASKADLIIIGCRGTSGLQRVLLGSVSSSVLVHAACSVEIAKDFEPGHHRAQNAHNVLIALEESLFSEAAFDFALSQKWIAKSQIKLVTVVKPLAVLIEEVNTFFGQNAEVEFQNLLSSNAAWLEVKANRLKEILEPENVSFEVLTGDPRDMILQTATEWPADLIIMGSHRRQGLSKLLVGSVSQAIAQHSSCSVQVVKTSLPS